MRLISIKHVHKPEVFQQRTLLTDARVLEIRFCVFCVLTDFFVFVKEPFCGFQEPSFFFLFSYFFESFFKIYFYVSANGENINSVLVYCVCIEIISCFSFVSFSMYFLKNN